MESTPPSRILRQRHTPTPKMSERKKSLFTASSKQQLYQLPATIDEDSDLGPMSPLQFSCSPSSSRDPNSSPRRMRSNNATGDGTPATDFRNLMQKLSPCRPVSERYEALTPTSQRWPSAGNTQPPPSVANNAAAAVLTQGSDLEKENYTTAAQLAADDHQKTPTAAGKTDHMPRKSHRKSVIFDTSLTPTADHTSAGNASSSGGGDEASRARASLSFAAKQTPGISARSFYGSSSEATKPATPFQATAARKSLNTAAKSPPTSSSTSSASSTRYRRSRGTGNFQPRLSSGGTQARGSHRGHRITKPKASIVKPTISSGGNKLLTAATTTKTATPHASGGRKFTSRAEVVAAALALIESHAQVTRAIRDNSIVAAAAAAKEHGSTSAVAVAAAAEEQATQITQTQIEKLQRILGKQRNAYELSSKQLNWIGGGSGNGSSSSAGSNQLETTLDMDNTFGHMSVLETTLNSTVAATMAGVDEAAAALEPADGKPAQKRKFFKSDQTNVHQYTVMRGICASVKRGAVVTLMSPPKKKSRHSQAEYAELRAIQQEVTDIISMLEEPAESPPHSVAAASAVEHESPTTTPEDIIAPEDIAVPLTVQDEATALANYERFAALLPYGCVDAETQQRQLTLLNLLYTQRICNDRTFRIFIEEPELHEAVATQILDQLFQLDVVSSQPSPPLRASMDVPVSPASQISSLTSAMELGSPGRAVSGTAAKPMFPVFYKELAVSGVDAQTQTSLEATASTLPRPIAWRAYGRDSRQLQIDAGQRSFGGAQCNECGMFYARHEPEDEALHQRFHAQTVRLQFNGWVDERVVAEVPEWGRGGRIVCVTLADAKAKRTRCGELLTMVDEQLGMAEEGATVHERSVIYLAIARRQVVGICVAEPLQYAHPLRLPDTGDDATAVPMVDLTSTRPVRCGLSRLWVCEAFRRHGIGSRLYAAVCEHFVRGEVTRLQAADVAFAAPTEAGWRFAGRMVGGLEAVLVYE